MPSFFSGTSSTRLVVPVRAPVWVATFTPR